MSYKPLKLGSSPESGYINSMMPTNGLNLEVNPQLMNLANALRLINYIPHPYGIEKRRGLEKVFERAGANPITLLKKFTNANVWIVGYSTKIEAYNLNTDAWTIIKSDFSVNNGFGGAKYGDYFFVCNGVEKVWRIDLALTITEIATSPVCGDLKVIGARMYALRLATDGIKYSETDDASNPPFDSWTESTAADTAGAVNYRQIGVIRSVCQLGEYTVAFGDDGFFAFRINVIDSGGTLKKIEVIQNYTEDFGGARGAIETPDGIFYLNEAGMWQMVAVGVTFTPMSRQQVLTSTNLGSKYFQNVNQSSSDLVYDANQKCIFATIAKDSETNNLVIGYKPEMKALFEFKNWNINRFAIDGNTIYGASSIKTTVYELFTGYDDDGLPIGTEVYQELPLKTLFHAHSLSEMYAAGFLSSGTRLTVSFDIYDVEGRFIQNYDSYLWTAQHSNGTFDEWGSAAWGESGWSGTYDTGGLVESFDGGSPVIAEFQRLRVRITGGDRLRHIINWAAFKTTKLQPILRRHITLIE